MCNFFCLAELRCLNKSLSKPVMLDKTLCSVEGPGNDPSAREKGVYGRAQSFGSRVTPTRGTWIAVVCTRCCLLPSEG